MNKITLNKTTDIQKLKNYAPSCVIIYDSDGQVLLKELSLVAFNTFTNKVLVIGNEAEGIDDVRVQIELFKQLDEAVQQQTLRELRKKNKFNIKKLAQSIEELIHPDAVLVGSPLQNGVVADLIAAKIMFRYFIGKTLFSSSFFGFKPHIAICNPGEVTSAMHDVFIALFLEAGCRSVTFFNKSCEEARYDIPSKCKFIVEIVGRECSI